MLCDGPSIMVAHNTLCSEYLARIVLSTLLKIGVWDFQRINKKKVLRIENSIRGSLSELKSSLSGLFRPSHLPHKTKSEKCSIFVLIFISPYFPYYPLKGLPIEPSMACHLINKVALQEVSEPTMWPGRSEAPAASPERPQLALPGGPEHHNLYLDFTLQSGSP